MSDVRDHTDDLKIVGKRYYGRWLSALVVLLCVVAMAHSMINNPRFEWSVIAENFTGESILQGVLMTLQLTAISGLCFWYGAGADAPFIEPSAGGRQLVLHLVLPRCADAGAIVPVVQHRRALSDDFTLDSRIG